MTRLLIKHAQMVEQPGQLIDILIEDERIAAIGSSLAVSGDEVIDARGALVMPGLVDVHVHFRDPGQTDKETITTGSKAAARGGFTTVLAMPNVQPVPNTAATLHEMVIHNHEKGLVHIEQYAAVSAELTDQSINDLVGLAQAGAVAFSNDGKGVQSAATMLAAMKAAVKAKRVLSAHLEDNDLMGHGVVDQSIADQLQVAGIDPLAETSQLARDLVLAQATGAHYHVAHLSTKGSVELVRLAKLHGVHVTAEVTPHHLLLDTTAIHARKDVNLKMNPPLRTPTDRAAVVAGLLDGTIDMVATDHAPHTVADKAGDLISAAFGITGLETCFPLLYTHLVRPGIATLAQVQRWLNQAPVKAFNLTAPTTIQVGQQADLALFDLEHAHPIQTDEFASKGMNTPFIDEIVYGMTVATIVDGKLVYRAD